MRRSVKNGLALLTVFALAGMVLASGPQFGQNKGNGPAPQHGPGRPVQQPVHPKSTPPLAVPPGRGTTQHKPLDTHVKPHPIGSKPGDHQHPATASTKPGSTGNKTATHAPPASKVRTKDDVTSGGSSSTIINNNNNNDNITINNFGFGSPAWGGWGAWSGSFLWGGGAWGVWGLPAYLPFALWSPIHEPFVFLP